MKKNTHTYSEPHQIHDKKLTPYISKKCVFWKKKTK